MAIEFKCLTCGKDLFAQEQYAGLRTTCPGCQSKMQIPIPTPVPLPTAPTEVAPSAALVPLLGDQKSVEDPVEPQVLDMEKVVPSAAPEQTKRCPMCAEKILAAAKKCRFCGEILDVDLKENDIEIKRKAAVMAGYIAARRSDAVWRGTSILATMLTTGWLLFQTMNCIVLKTEPFGLSFLSPWPMYLFNVLLIGGLLSLIRQMKNGPYHVFLAAGISIVLCMPLDIFLGLPLQGIDQFIVEAKKNEFYKDWTPDGLNTMYSAIFAIASGLIGMIISLPVWFTAIRVALQARMNQRMK